MLLKVSSLEERLTGLLKYMRDIYFQEASLLGSWTPSRNALGYTLINLT